MGMGGNSRMLSVALAGWWNSGCQGSEVARFDVFEQLEDVGSKKLNDE